MRCTRTGVGETTLPADDTAQTPTRGYLDLTPIGHYGRFELLGRLAYGGMAEIFLARQTLEGGGRRHLVVKRVLSHVADDERFLGMFQDEARLAMHLNHPNICHIYEFGQTEGTHFIAMEWVDGVPLKKLIRRARSEYGIPVPFAAKIIADVAGALHYAHRARDDAGNHLGIVHRDVSPPNIMINFHGAVKLLDFGVAKARSHLTKTQTGAVKGKFAYMAPEQCLGQDVDHRADVFALGVCLYEALTGKWLYARSTEFETMRAIVMEEKAPSARAARPEVPEELDAIVRTALARDVSARYQSAGEMREALERALVARGEVVNDAHIANYLGQLFRDEIQRGPVIDSTPLASSLSAPSGVQARQAPSGMSSVPDATAPAAESQLLAHEADLDVDDFARARRRKNLLVTLLLLLLVGGGGFAVLHAVLADEPAGAAGAGTETEPEAGSETGAGSGSETEAEPGRRGPRFQPARPPSREP